MKQIVKMLMQVMVMATRRRKGGKITKIGNTGNGIKVPLMMQILTRMGNRGLKNHADIAVTVKNRESMHTPPNQMVKAMKAGRKGTKEITGMVPIEMVVMRSLVRMGKFANNPWQQRMISEFREMESGDKKLKSWELIKF